MLEVVDLRNIEHRDIGGVGVVKQIVLVIVLRRKKSLEWIHSRDNGARERALFV